MIFSIELQRLPNGHVKASTSTDVDGLWAIRPTVSEAILAVSPGDTDVVLPESTLGLGDPDLHRIEKKLLGGIGGNLQTKAALAAVDGDSQNMRDVLSNAIRTGADIRLDYTDAAGKESQRIVTPIEVTWGSNERVLKARDGGTLKTFYLSRIDRAEIV